MHLLLILLTLTAVLTQLSDAVSSSSKSDGSTEEEDIVRKDSSPLTLEMLTRLCPRVLISSQKHKRGFDFGLGRGYSGNQAAKHYMGLVASQFAGGPGKRNGERKHQLRRDGLYEIPFSTI